MNKKFIILSFLVLFLILGGIAVYLRQKSNFSPKFNPEIQDKKINIDQSTLKNNSQGFLVLYYGQGCPHCALVEDFINQNNILSKIKIEQKEVYYNKNNANDLIEKARICGINTNAIGVPFLWTGKECILGDKPIIDFLQNKLINN